MKSILKNKKRYLILLLVYLVVLSMYLLSNIKAKYVNYKTIEQNARVAEFIFDIDQQKSTYEVNLNLDPTVKTNPQSIQIVGESEDAFEVLVTMKVMGNLPLHISFDPVTVEDVTYTAPEVLNTLNTTYNNMEDSDGVMTIKMGPIHYSAAKSIDQTITYSITWSDEPGYDLAIYENGVEYIELNVEVNQVN